VKGYDELKYFLKSISIPFARLGFCPEFYSLDFDYEKDTLLSYLRAFVPKSFYSGKKAFWVSLETALPPVLGKEKIH
jgi:hypothetical protein